jgi:LL-diaminopimelate aminotransferase
MVKRNPHLAKLQSGYLFPEINKRKHRFLEQNPQARLISLGIGDTSEPIPLPIVEGLKQEAIALGTREGYTGYGPEKGSSPLRKRIAEELYQNRVDSEEVFISDGSKCDIGRLQILFGSQSTIAVQDPSYPVYIDTGVILGQTGPYTPFSSGYDKIVYMPCRPENGFFPDLTEVKPTNLIYFCSPNNPTGAVATHEQLTLLVKWAQEHRSILIYDAAYSAYIQDPHLPRSIYEIEGARNVAIELGSFSKMIGFTGVRLAWSIIPKTLCFEDGSSVHQDWSRIHSTFFNGASNLAQAGGLAALTPHGLTAMKELIDFYMINTQLIKSALTEIGYEVYGGEQAPYIWVKYPTLTSWEAFDHLLERAHLICTPGSGFGPGGEGFVRFSAFGNRETILEAIDRLKRLNERKTDEIR